MEFISVIQHTVNTLQISALYSLVACGFYLVSVSVRHFAFAAATGFIVAPYMALSSPDGFGQLFLIAIGLAACMLMGFIYSAFSNAVSRRGGREGELLIISLAVMSIGENIITILFDSASRSLRSYDFPHLILILSGGVSLERLFVIAVALIILLLLIFAWHQSLVGTILRGLVESRLNLSIRGLPVLAIEGVISAIGFLLFGVAGVLWAFDGRVKPVMCTEIGVIGAITFIVGDILGSGPIVLIATAVGLAILRLLFSLVLGGDWTMTSIIVLLVIVFLEKLRRGARVEAVL